MGNEFLFVLAAAQVYIAKLELRPQKKKFDGGDMDGTGALRSWLQ